tara:strand:- start:221 stop:436 length:216 start_codon:yes stop_codon:yes gene_type:complete
MEAWAKSESRTLANLLGLFIAEGVSCYGFSHEILIKKLENDRDQSQDKDSPQYYSDEEVTKLYEHLALQQL